MDEVNELKLGFFKTHEKVTLPVFATKQSACFDLSYQCWGKTHYSGHTKENGTFERLLVPHGQITLTPGDRAMIPTGLIMDIPLGFSLRVHARSGLALKHGLVLVNSEGIIDSDYVQELFLLMMNISHTNMVIPNGERIAQGELVRQESYEFEELLKQPKKKTSRKGGMGSTGTKAPTS